MSHQGMLEGNKGGLGEIKKCNFERLSKFLLHPEEDRRTPSGVRMRGPDRGASFPSQGMLGSQDERRSRGASLLAVRETERGSPVAPTRTKWDRLRATKVLKGHKYRRSRQSKDRAKAVQPINDRGSTPPILGHHVGQLKSATSNASQSSCYILKKTEEHVRP